MISYSYIEKNLRSLNHRYNRSKTTREADFLSKLAVLELCGWLEVSIDNMIYSTSSRLINNTSNIKFLENKIKRTNGFEYEQDFRPLIAFVIGLAGLEEIEKSIDSSVCIKFKSELSALKIRRNSLAHTYTKGATLSYDAPSVTLVRLQDVAAGLKAYEAALRNFRI